MVKEQKELSYIKYFLYLASGYSFLTYLYYLLKELLMNKFHDFAYYYIYTALLQKGVDIWRYAEDPQIVTKINAMASALGFPQITIGLQHSLGFFFMVSPFAMMPFNAASVSWVLLCQLSFAVFIILTFKILNNLDELQILCAICLIFNFWPLFENAHLAQVNFIVLLFLTLAFMSLKNKQLFLAGIFLGLAIQLKEVFLPMVLFLMVKKYWRALWGVIAIICAVKIASIFAFGMNREISYWRYLINYWLLTDKPPSLYNISVAAAFKRIIENLMSIRFVQIALLPAYIFLFIKAWRLTGSRQVAVRQAPANTKETPAFNPVGTQFLEYALFISLSFIVNPWLNEPLFIILYLPLLAAWNYIVKFPARSNFILYAIIYLILGLKYSVISFPFFSAGLPSLLLSAGVLGYLLLFYLIYKLLKNSR